KATETLEVFAPLANRMGLGKWRSELEDLSFKYLAPEAYEQLLNQVASEEAEWRKSIKEMKEELGAALGALTIEARVYGRVKNYFSIYRKMTGQDKKLQDVYDLGALRIIVANEKECYETLGAVHSHYKPIPGRFKDYVAMPKSNLYQSLHTTVIGPNGRPIEVQIRTEEMHRIAEYGIAAHWHYKQVGASATADVQSDDEQKLTWLKQLIELKEESGDAQEYFENVKFDLFQDEVFVFTPKGDVFDLPRGSTPVDFAYRIHTEVGHACTGSMVNGKIVPLNYVLKNGDIIEIMTAKKASPKVDWIKFVQTQHARASIRQWYKKNFREDHIAQGRSLIEAEMTKADYEEMLKGGTLVDVAHQLNYAKVDDMLLALGYGELTVPKVMNRLRKKETETTKATPETTNLEVLAQRSNILRRRARPKGGGEQIEGLEGMLYHMAKCCNPLPGDEIVGVVTRSRGVMVHRIDCLNLDHVREERKMDIMWTSNAIDNSEQLRSVRLDIHVIDRIGIFKDILIRIADKNTNVSNARVKKLLTDNTALLEITVDIADLAHLEKVKTTIQNLSDVISVKRSQLRPIRNNAAGGGGAAE
ncbi:MAG: bifunctional (p)ppGpp synthetase/guanosine-3',5'-bis(diphosphate) 3'-pyrophosphohydrolase, partial [Cyanobacteria bacterium HKST-UBA05]|nr:bifunctional (p)ppGpp synthetase/guanosine-3',5'-bis(diphosphate) 3'-pyrophosphohydrolase [Cyanobacteria bacterium HKST-UBA05]